MTAAPGPHADAGLSGPIEVLIWGAGGIGSLVGAYLARAGHPVMVVSRDREHVAAVRSAGLFVEGPVETFRVDLGASLPEDVRGEWPLAFLAVKAQDTAGAAASLAPHVSARGSLVTLQNGLTRAIVVSAFGSERTLSGFINAGVDLVAPGRVMYGNRGALAIGDPEHGVSERVDAIAELLRRFEPGARATDNVDGFLWSKLAYIGMLFVTTVLGAEISECFEDPHVRPALVAVAREILVVTVEAGVRPERFDAFDPWPFLSTDERSVRDVLDRMAAFYRSTAKKRSGMWRDLAVRHKRTEVDELMGPVLNTARRRSVDMPLTRELVTVVHEIESGDEAIGAWHLGRLVGMMAPARWTADR